MFIVTLSCLTSVGCIDSDVDVEVGSLVLLAGDRTGRVCYIGHLDHGTNTNMIYTGIELDSASKLYP